MIAPLTIFLMILLCSPFHAAAFSAPNTPNTPNNNNNNKQHAGDNDPSVSRRTLLWKAPLGAVGVYAYGRLAYNALSTVNGGRIERPAVHEERVAATIQTALSAAAAAAASSPGRSSDRSSSSSTPRLLRVLEVGMGTDARLIRRGLYDAAIRDLSGKMDRLELTGLDIRLPNNRTASSKKVLEDATAKLTRLGTKEGLTIDLQLIEASITAKTMQFSDGYFDSIICCMTLCSVIDQEAALQEMKRLLRSSGGTLGYVEHVAVGDDGDGGSHQFLEFQQKLLDPLQQRVADNCHLHRYTEQAVATVFQPNDNKSRYLQKERFYVNNMWPVSCQSCGVIQRI